MVTAKEALALSVIALVDLRDIFNVLNQEKDLADFFSNFIMTLVKNAVASVKSNIDTSIDLDVNNDGDVDCISFLAYGDNQGDIFWSHKWSLFSEYAETINGKSVNFFTFIADRRLDYDIDSRGAVGALTHETLHVLGFPDMYGTNPSYLGSWDVMSYNVGQHPSAYLKEKYGQWVETKEITSSGRYTLNPLTALMNNNYIIKSPYNYDEYIMVEYRKKTSNGVFESLLPNSGLLIYRVNEDAVTNKELYIYRDSNENLSNAAYKAPNKIYFGSDSDPASIFNNGEDSGISIQNVSEIGETISFDVVLNFKDKRIENAIREQLGKPYAQLTLTDYASIEELTITGCDSSLELEGIENLVNLKKLTLNNCKIINASNISQLINLEELSLVNNEITSINGFECLEKLNKLLLNGNNISDYSPTQKYYDNLMRKDFLLNGEQYHILSNLPTSYFSGMISNLNVVAKGSFPERVIAKINYRTASAQSTIEETHTIILDDSGLGNIHLDSNIDISETGSHIELSYYDYYNTEKLLCRQKIYLSLFRF